MTVLHFHRGALLGLGWSARHGYKRTAGIPPGLRHIDHGWRHPGTGWIVITNNAGDVAIQLQGEAGLTRTVTKGQPDTLWIQTGPERGHWVSEVVIGAGPSMAAAVEDAKKGVAALSTGTSAAPPLPADLLAAARGQLMGGAALTTADLADEWTQMALEERGGPQTDDEDDTATAWVRGGAAAALAVAGVILAVVAVVAWRRNA